MSIKSYICDSGTNKTVNIKSIDGDNALIVLSHPLKSYKYINKYFVSDKYGIEMNVDMNVTPTQEGIIFDEYIGLSDDSTSQSEWNVNIISGNSWKVNDVVVYNGLKSMDCRLLGYNDTVEFDNISIFSTNGYNYLTGYVYIVSWSNIQKGIVIYGYDNINNKLVGNEVELGNYININLFNAWQKFIIPLRDMSLTSKDITSIRFKCTENVSTVAGGLWSIVSDSNVARRGLSGCGTILGSLSFGGYKNYVDVPTTELWNGSLWTVTSELNNPRRYAAGCGTTSDALYFGGYGITISEIWNGTSWALTSGLNLARSQPGGCGTTSDALCFGGYKDDTGECDLTEIWNGISWATTSSLNVARHLFTGCGTTSDALCFGGRLGDVGANTFDTTEIWNGISWATTSSLNLARFGLAGCGTTSDALCFGGNSGNITGRTEMWNGISWTTTSSLNIARCYFAGSGTMSDALSFCGYTGSNVTTTEMWNLDYSHTMSFYMDYIKLENILNQIEYELKPENDNSLYVSEIYFNLVGTCDETYVKLSYDKLMNIKLDNGILIKIIKDNETYETIVVRDLYDIISLIPSSEIISSGNDNNSMWIKIRFNFGQPVMLKPNNSDKIVVSIRDDLSDLLKFRASALCYE